MKNLYTSTVVGLCMLAGITLSIPAFTYATKTVPANTPTITEEVEKQSLLSSVISFFINLFKRDASYQAALVLPSASPQPLNDQKITEVEYYNILLSSYIKRTGPDLSAEKISAIIRQRKDLLKELAYLNPKVFYKLARPEFAKASRLAAHKEFLEEKTKIVGNLTVLHIDDFNNPENSRFTFTLEARNKKYDLLTITEFPEQRSGKAQVTGITLDDFMVIDKSGVEALPSAAQRGEALGTQGLLALIVETLDETSPVGVEEVERVLFATTSNFQRYFKEQSYGKTDFKGDVYKMRIDRQARSECGSGLSINDADIQNELNLQNVDLSLYDRILFIPLIGYCSNVGKRDYSIGGKTYSFSESWVGWGEFLNYVQNIDSGKTLAHEMGHGLGVMHANFLLCENGECESEEYGNHFDIMGYGYGHFNALFKEQLGWLEAADMLSVTRSGTYSMGPLELQTGIRAAKIVNPRIGPLSVVYLESRRDVDAGDRRAEGQENRLLLNIPERPQHLSVTQPWLIDMRPGVPQGDRYDDQKNVSLGVGESYALDSHGYTIGPVYVASSTNMRFSVDVHTPVCTSQQPFIPQNSMVHYGIVGSRVTIEIDFVNRDPVCDPVSSFSLEITNLPTGWVIDPDRSTLLARDIGIHQYGFLSATFQFNENVQPGEYTIRYRVKNIETNTFVEKDAKVKVMSHPTIEVDPQVLEPGQEFTLRTNLQLTEDNLPWGVVQFTGPDFFYAFNRLKLDGSLISKIPAEVPVNDACHTECEMRPLRPGIYTVELIVYNGFSLPYQVSIGANAVPGITITSPIDEAVYDAGSIVPIQWTSTEISSVVMSIRYDGGRLGAVQYANEIRLPPNGKYAWAIPRSANAGKYIITLKGNDWPESVSVTVNVNAKKAPYLDYISPAKVIQGTEVTLYGSGFESTTVTLTNTRGEVQTLTPKYITTSKIVLPTASIPTGIYQVAVVSEAGFPSKTKILYVEANPTSKPVMRQQTTSSGGGSSSPSPVPTETASPSASPSPAF